MKSKEGKIDFTKAQLGSATEIKKGDLIALTIRTQPERAAFSTTSKRKKVEGSASGGDSDACGAPNHQRRVVDKRRLYIGYVGELPGRRQRGRCGRVQPSRPELLKGRAIVQGSGTFEVGGKIKFTEQPLNPEGAIISVRHVVERGTGFITEIHFCGNTFPASGKDSGSSGSEASDTPVASSGPQRLRQPRRTR